MKCKFCEQECTKAGKQKNGAQKYYCNRCSKYQQSVYVYHACKHDTGLKIPLLLCEGVGIRSIGRILKIGVNTVLSRIKVIAGLCHAPGLENPGQQYEIDEVRTYVGNKKNECWLTYCITRETKKVTAFTVGKRTKIQLGKITSHVLKTNPQKVYTDRLPVYKSLLPSLLHYAGNYCTNRIERYNLNIRTHLKRLSRKTICFSKSIEMLEACLKIYFWYRRAYMVLGWHADDAKKTDQHGFNPLLSVFSVSSVCHPSL